MKKFGKLIGIFLGLFLIYFAYTTYQKLDLISGFSAKSVASGHFIDDRSLEIIEQGDNDIPKIVWAKNSIIQEENLATASVFGLKERKAFFREGIGATLINDEFDVSKPYLVPKRIKQSNNLAFPYGNKEQKDTVFSNIDYKKLQKAVANAFDKKGLKEKRTRSVLIMYKDKIIAEKYATGFDKNSKILGWSMTKSITATLIGILQKQRNFDIYKPAPFPEWANDARAKITTSNLIQMNSGLEWEEDYTKISDVTKMLFQDEDMTQTQIEKRLVGEPNN